MALIKYRKVIDKTMFPSKNMENCVGETSRFFPTIGIDGDTSLNTYTSPFHTNANRYSSSTDSASPESYFNISYPITSEQHSQQARSASPRPLFYETNRPNYPTALDSTNYFQQSVSNLNTLPQNSNTIASNERNFSISESQTFDTPFQARQQRPIVGRKILGSHSNHFINELNKPDDDTPNVWRNNTPQSSDNFTNLYELFPSNEVRLQAPSYTLSRTTSSASLPTQNFSPPWTNRVHNPLSTFKTPFNPAAYTGTSTRDEISPSKMCTFCRKNGETPKVYMTHCVKEKNGNKYTVTCPILRSHVCNACGAFGDDAHTITYCPILRRSNNGKPLPSTTVTLKSTRIKSDGRRRY